MYFDFKEENRIVKEQIFNGVWRLQKYLAPEVID
jgi:hypothetical protein